MGHANQWPLNRLFLNSLTVAMPPHPSLSPVVPGLCHYPPHGERPAVRQRLLAFCSTFVKDGEIVLFVQKKIQQSLFFFSRRRLRQRSCVGKPQGNQRNGFNIRRITDNSDGVCLTFYIYIYVCLFICPFVYLDGWSLGYFVACLLGWLVSFLVGWLVGCVVRPLENTSLFQSVSKLRHIMI